MNEKGKEQGRQGEERRGRKGSGNEREGGRTEEERREEKIARRNIMDAFSSFRVFSLSTL